MKINIKKPKISVVMSVYNGEKYLKEAVMSLINQTFADWELIAVNDCSTDSTREILEEYARIDERIKVYNNETNLKLAKSLNKGVQNASGKYIARMDCDDISLPERLEKQYRFMEENPDISLSSCRFFTLKNGVYSSGGGGTRCDFEAVKAMLLVSNPILHPGVIAKSRALKSFPYDENLTCTEDLELWTRMAKNGLKLGILDEYLVIYRLHDKQITYTTYERQKLEVMEIEQKYHGSLLERIDEKTADFYINGVYFREKTDIKKLCDFFGKIRVVNKKKNAFRRDCISYAFLEILAEYKRHGVGSFDIIRGLLHINPVFLAHEMKARKKRAEKDAKKCIETAEKNGLDVNFLSFEMRKMQ